jgi:hypothetical protein
VKACIAIVIALLAINNVSAATAEFVRFKGRQQAWRIDKLDHSVPGFSLPVYFGLPDRRYEFIGYVLVYQFAVEPQVTREEAIRSAVAAGRSHQADAIRIMPIPGSFVKSSERIAVVYAAVIKWVDGEEKTDE